MFDFVRQYLKSPIWKTPILNYMEKHCSTFKDEEENQMEYTKIFNEFNKLVVELLNTMLT